MKKLIIAGLLLTQAILIRATSYEPGIKSVVVYRSGAEITQEVSFPVTAGSQEIVLTNMTSTIDANSLQVKVFGNATLLSASVRTNYMGYEKLPERTREIRDSLQLIRDGIEWLNNEQAVNLGEEKLLQENQKIVNEKTVVTAADINQLADMYRNRLLAVRKRIHKNTQELRRMEAVKSRLEKQLAELQHQSGKRMGEVVLNISSSQSARIRVQLSYLTRNAGWNPVYDIRCSSVTKPVNLVYKANIYQTTGFDWDQIDLSVSTGNPTVNNQRPVLNPWFIDFLRAYNANNGAQFKSAAPARMESNMMILEDEVSLEYDMEEEQSVVPFVVNQEANQMSVQYEIGVKQSVPADGKEHIVPLQEYELPAAYNYHAVPKLSNYAFLLAKIGNYNQYNLLPGNANVFFEGMFIGQTVLNPETTSDSLIVSLGRDDRISIQRNILSDFTARKVVGTSQKVTKGYEMVIRNNKQEPVSLEILDQVPISQNKEIEVTMDEISGAEVYADYGRLLWNTTLKPGETKKIRLIYTVKFPKDQQIAGF